LLSSGCTVRGSQCGCVGGLSATEEGSVPALQIWGVPEVRGVLLSALQPHCRDVGVPRECCAQRIAAVGALWL